MRKPSSTTDNQAMDDALIARVQKQAWFHRYPRGWPFLLFVLTMAVTAAAVIAMQRADDQARAAELDRTATEIVSGLERHTSENVAQLRAVAALVASRGALTNREFDEIVDSAYQREDPRSVVSTGWAPLIRVSDLAAFEAAQRAQGTADFAVWPRPSQGNQLLAPVAAVAPAVTYKRPVIGFDVLSRRERRVSIESAMRLDRAIATPRLRLVPSGLEPAKIGFVIYMPVQRVTGGRRRLVGLVFSPFSADDFLAIASEPYRSRNVEIAVYDGAVNAGNLLALREVAGATGGRIDRHVTVAGREWTVRVTNKNNALLNPLARATLVFGVLAAVLIMFTARLITRRALEDRNLLEWAARQEAIRTQLTRELNHRVKNTLANVLSIVALTRRRAKDLNEFAEGLTARLRALSATHDILSQSNWTEAAVGEIIHSELAPYLHTGEGQINLHGPQVSLAANDALSLGLAIHELATNAAKYGALFSRRPTVASLCGLANGRPKSIGASAADHRTPPTRRGFGLDLIEKVVAHELRTEVGLKFAPEGVECVLRVPVRRTSEFVLRQGKPA